MICKEAQFLIIGLRLHAIDLIFIRLNFRDLDWSNHICQSITLYIESDLEKDFHLYLWN